MKVSVAGERRAKRATTELTELTSIINYILIYFIFAFAGGKIIRVEAHPIPEHARPRRVQGRIALVGDAAGYVTKCSGEGIYFAAKSGRMAAQAIVKLMKNGSRLPTQEEIEATYIKDYDKAYGPTYAVLDILQKVS